MCQRVAVKGTAGGYSQNRHYLMKVKQNRHGQTLRRAIGARLAWIAGLAMVVILVPGGTRAQSAGMAHLLHPKSQQGEDANASAAAAPPREREREQADQREARGRAEKYRSERDMAERAGRQGPAGGKPKLSPDERKTLRKNLYDLGREMYQGG